MASNAASISAGLNVPAVPVVSAIPIATPEVHLDTDQTLRECAQELMRELNEMLNSKNISRESETAKLMIGLIADYLKRGGAGIEKCSTCDIHEWRRNHNNNFWEVVCHDPGKCPAVPRQVPNFGVLRSDSNDHHHYGVPRNDHGFFRRNSGVARHDFGVLRR